MELGRRPVEQVNVLPEEDLERRLRVLEQFKFEPRARRAARRAELGVLRGVDETLDRAADRVNLRQRRRCVDAGRLLKLSVLSGAIVRGSATPALAASEMLPRLIFDVSSMLGMRS
jgi:hypothetical protein